MLVRQSTMSARAFRSTPFVSASASGVPISKKRSSATYPPSQPCSASLLTDLTEIGGPARGKHARLEREQPIVDRNACPVACVCRTLARHPRRRRRLVPSGRRSRGRSSARHPPDAGARRDGPVVDPEVRARQDHGNLSTRSSTPSSSRQPCPTCDGSVERYRTVQAEACTVPDRSFDLLTEMPDTDHDPSRSAAGQQSHWCRRKRLSLAH